MKKPEKTFFKTTLKDSIKKRKKTLPQHFFRCLELLVQPIDLVNSFQADIWHGWDKRSIFGKGNSSPHLWLTSRIKYIGCGVYQPTSPEFGNGERNDLLVVGISNPLVGLAWMAIHARVTTTTTQADL
ncbi:hypothetical protein CRENBAI_021004 [Crenichthys baileyi]|uniref:Uncharacterized protein n=1 Tax=Crenichthys baileyi TaxID=28760 RepID=A0AAV9QZ24_9TELE